MELKKAYETFIEAIKDETGAIPNINIYFHTSSNLMTNSKAKEIAEIMGEAMGASNIERNPSNTDTEWWQTEGAERVKATAFFDLDTEQEDTTDD